MTSFDPLSQPIAGAHSIEASAGTGKTFSITLLWLRLLIEKELTVPQILVSTFTRAATAELSERLLASLRRALAAAQAPEDQPPEENSPELQLVQRHCQNDPLRKRTLAQRLAQALSSFDLAPITTLHGFCQSLIARHALEIGCDPGITLVENADDLLEDLLNDEAMRLAESTPLELKKLRNIARAVASNPTAALHLSPSQTPAKTIAEAVRSKLPERKNAAALRSFDDLLLIVRDALRAEHANGPLAQAVRQRLKAAIIDECQDSDGVQIEVFEALFKHPHTTAFLVIGDPKQSIYRFRGADLASYKKLASSEHVTQAPPMTVNHRSDGHVINALNALYQNAFLFPDSLSPETPTRYIPVSANAQESRILDPHLQTGLAFLFTRETERPLAKWDLAHQVAIECKRLLQSGVLITERHSKTGERRPLRPGDIAVLAGLRSDLQLVRRQLQAAQIPSQLGGRGSGSILSCPEAFDLLAWLEVFATLEGGSRGSLLTKLLAFLSTPLAGLSPEQLLHLPKDPTAQARHATRFQSQLQKLHASGPLPVLLLHLADSTALAAQLPFHEGERRITNWRQIASLLQQQHARGLRSAETLALWLNRQIANPNDSAHPENSDSLSLKLDSDAEAVQLQTIHGAKGLEYPIVFCPFLWHLKSREKGRSPALLFRDSKGWNLDIESPDSPEHEELSRAQQDEENHRVLYVALTRPRHRLYLGAAAIPDSKRYRNGSSQSALAALLRRHPDHPTPESPEDWEPLLLSQPHSRLWNPRAIATSPTNPPPSQTPTRPLHSPPNLSRRLQSRFWRKLSFTTLSRSQPEHDDPADRDEEPSTEPIARVEPGLLAPLGLGGSDLGDRLHRVLEGLLGNRQPLHELLPSETDPAPWETIVAIILNQNLPLAHGQTSPLAAFTRLGQRCITEMQFHLPVSTLDPQQLSEALLADPSIAQDEARREWALAIPDWQFTPFHGFLQGFIDLIFEHQGLWYIVDYKSNQLPAYTPELVEEKMLESHYLLQARLYSVALHRHLRAHLPDYAPQRHFGGVLYLFVRGFPDQGIWFDRPSTEALDALDALFANPR